MARYTLKVYPAGRGREIYRMIVISGEDTLDDLCEFCMDNRMYSEDSYQYDPEDGDPSTDVIIDKIGLVKGQNFSLHYDYGDDWMFTIHVQKVEDEAHRAKPELIKSVGFLEQYPDYDEWDEEDDF